MSGASPEVVSLPRGGNPTESIGTGPGGLDEQNLECVWQHIAETSGPAFERAVFQYGSHVQAIPGAGERHVEQALGFFALTHALLLVHIGDEWTHRNLVRRDANGLGKAARALRQIHDYNRIAAETAKAGIQQGLHNEAFETATIDGKRVYDTLLQLLDPTLVKFQFQISTMRDGFDPVEYFTKYPGRFMSMHAQDWSAADTKQMKAIGQGAVDWKKVFDAAKIGGVKNYFVEMNLDLMKESVPYLRQLNV